MDQKLGCAGSRVGRERLRASTLYRLHVRTIVPARDCCVLAWARGLLELVRIPRSQMLVCVSEGAIACV